MAHAECVQERIIPRHVDFGWIRGQPDLNGKPLWKLGPGSIVTYCGYSAQDNRNPRIEWHWVSVESVQEPWNHEGWSSSHILERVVTEREMTNEPSRVPLATRAGPTPKSPQRTSPSIGDTKSTPFMVPMENVGGVYQVPIRINDTITLDAILDSSATDVCIPADIVLTLIRSKTIASEDFLGSKTYTLADGSEVPSQRFIIKSLKVGNKTLENVAASIVSVDAQILLGQSFLRRFRSWSIDNEKHSLILN